MEGGHEPRSLALVPAAMVARDEDLLAQRVAAGDFAQQHDDPGPNQRHLLAQIVQARLGLVRLGIAVLRRTALDHVADVHVGALDADGVDHPRQQFARAADEGPAQPILLLPRALADEHQRGVGVALAGHDVAAVLAEPAFAAILQFLGKLGPRHAHRASPFLWQWQKFIW